MGIADHLLTIRGFYEAQKDGASVLIFPSFSNASKLCLFAVNGIKIIEQTARNASHGHYGSHDPNSPEDLHKLLSAITTGVYIIDAEYILPTHHADSGIVLNQPDMATIVGEFIATIGVYLLYRAMRQRYPIFNAQRGTDKPVAGFATDLPL